MDILNEDILYKMAESRDKRFDGQFYIGVKTTKIYCRPTCPARPQRKNMLFFKSQAAAENAGFRPCLRCRPDFSPHSVQWDGTKASVQRAIRLIECADADPIKVEDLAARLGIGERHLRRLFQKHLGASPQEVILSKRLHLARQLLSQTNYPITEIAYASGFQSIRRFNDAFKKTYFSTPSSFRKEKSVDKSATILEIPVLQPFDWQGQLRFFKRHQSEGIESVDKDRYHRSFTIGSETGSLTLSYKKPILRVEVNCDSIRPLPKINERIRKQFDLALNPEGIRFSCEDPVVRLWQSSKGTRLPGAFDPFETAVSIILGQAVSIKQANRFMASLIKNFGGKLKGAQEKISYTFPSPEDLSAAPLETIGITKSRAEAIRQLSKSLCEGALSLEAYAHVEETREALLAIKGIGPWTVSLILMRCLNVAHAVPKNDLFIKRLIEKGIDPDNWAPWGSYLTIVAWNHYEMLMEGI